MTLQKFKKCGFDANLDEIFTMFDILREANPSIKRRRTVIFGDREKTYNLVLTVELAL